VFVISRTRPVRSVCLLLSSTAVGRALCLWQALSLAARRRSAGASAAGTGARRGEAGQATVEYALVVLAAAGLALLAIAWAARTGRIGELFDRVFDRVVAGAG
jgi:hypothetical protein